MSELSPEMRALIETMGKQSDGLSAKQQSDLWIKLGVGAFGLLITLGLFVINSSISVAGEQAAANSEKIDTLTENVNRLVLVSEQQQAELGKRGDWMNGVNTYSEQSRLYDQRHEQQIEALEQRIIRLESQ